MLLSTTMPSVRTQTTLHSYLSFLFKGNLNFKKIIKILSSITQGKNIGNVCSTMLMRAFFYICIMGIRKICRNMADHIPITEKWILRRNGEIYQELFQSLRTTLVTKFSINATDEVCKISQIIIWN